MDGRRQFELSVVGGGIVGLATALALLSAGRRRVVVLEAEDRIAAHQSGHSSGVIHSGLYYRPGSLKARLSTAGRRELYRFCAEAGIPHRRCGKLVVAASTAEIPRLEELERRGRANGLQGLERLEPAAFREREPHAAGVAGLWVPETGVVDFTRVTNALAERVMNGGGEVRTGCRVLAVRPDGAGLTLETAGGEVRCERLINCAGLHSDRVARLCGARPEVAIVPFRGDYLELRPARAALVRGLIYPVPDPAFPFLGVHLTRTISGSVEAGPNAVLALDRNGYRRGSFSLRDAAEVATFPGFWRLARRHWRVGLAEVRRSLDRTAFVRSLQRLVPEIGVDDVRPGGCGIRAQAVGRDGHLLDDFHIVRSERAVHVLNAPSPAATAALAIGRHIAELVSG